MGTDWQVCDRHREWAEAGALIFPVVVSRRAHQQNPVVAQIAKGWEMPPAVAGTDRQIESRMIVA
jgi:hypothetical protein